MSPSKCIVLLLAAGTSLVHGCGQSPPAPTKAAETAVPEQPVSPPDQRASYPFEVRGENGSSQTLLSGNAETTLGGVRLRVRDGLLTVNGRSYGKLRAGDAVLIESDGQVLVNLEVREPW